MHGEHLAPGALPPEPPIPNYTDAEHVTVEREQRRNDYAKLYKEANSEQGLVRDPQLAHDIANRINPAMSEATAASQRADRQDIAAIEHANEVVINPRNDLLAQINDAGNRKLRQHALDKRVEALAVDEQMRGETEALARSKLRESG